jgi:subtilase family serine protease
VNFFLSASSTAVQPGDPLLGGRDVDRLAPGVTSRASTPITVPSNVSAGTYFVLAVADATGAVQEGDESNNTRAASNPIVIRQPDLVVTEVRGPAAGVGAAGQPLAVSVKVKNQALAPANAAAFRVGIYLSLDPAAGTGDLIGFIPVFGLAAGVTTASLTGTVTVPAALLDNTYFLSAVADWDERVPESNEDNNGLTAAQTVTIGRPDLILTRVSGPATNVGAAGQPLAVTLAVKNQGPVPATAGPFRIALYLSMSDVPGTGALIGNVSVTGVAAGATATVPATVVVPASLAAGTYFLAAVADFLDVVAESEELNNGLTSATEVAIRQPDLTLTRVTGPASNLGAAGQPLAVTLGVKNQGAPPANAGPFRVGLYLSPTDEPGTGVLIGNVSVSGVVAGALPLTVSGSVVVPASMAAGTYFLSAVADVEDRIAETDETNNGVVAANQVMIGRPDLQISRIAGPASGVGAAGQPLAVSLDVRNDAGVPANAGPFKVAVVLSSSSSSATGTLLGTLNVTGLAAGARTTLTATLPVPANVSANAYFVVAVADVEDRVLEVNEVNNLLGTATPVTIRAPDLTVLGATGPTTWSPGQPFTVSASVRNLGLAPAAAGAFRVGVFLSPIATGGTLVGSTAVTMLPPLATSSVTIPVMVPAGVAPGAYNIIVVADHEGRVTEPDEANNTFVVAAQVQIRRADLAVTALAGPSTGVRGRTISVANTVTNLGNAAATAVRVSFFVSPVDPRPGAGRQVGTRDILTLAATGAPASVSTVITMVTLPANLEPGSYFLSAVADSAGTVAEGEESNNALTASAQILVTAQ